MKSKIKYSYFSLIITWGVLVLLYAGCFVTLHDKRTFLILLSIFLVLIVIGLLYGAQQVEANNQYVIMKSPLRSRKLSLDNIQSIELFQPTMGAMRLFGSGGFLGYWGIYREADIGIYNAFYGRSSDCFLIRMKNGDKYVVGCEKPTQMVEYIKSSI